MPEWNDTSRICLGTGLGNAALSEDPIQKRADSPVPELVGIARLAASGDLLAAKRRVEYYQLPTRRFLTRCQSRRVPFRWTINPYRGCEFGCKYCYARYTHEFMELRDGRDFERRIFVKHWSARAFRQELRRIPRADWIALGTATDPYQPAERWHGITREILKVFAEQPGRRLSITTKSDLIVRDLELLRAVASGNILHVALSITTLDETLARRMEPFAPRPQLRMKAVTKLSAAGIQTAVLACPLLPLLNDSERSLDELAGAAARAGAASFAGGVVFLKPCTHAVFFPFIERHYPHLLARYRRRFTGRAYLSSTWSKMIEERLERARARHGLSKRFPDYRPERWEEEPQMCFRFADADGPESESTCA